MLFWIKRFLWLLWLLFSGGEDSFFVSAYAFVRVQAFENKFSC